MTSLDGAAVVCLALCMTVMACGPGLIADLDDAPRRTDARAPADDARPFPDTSRDEVALDTAGDSAVVEDTATAPDTKPVEPDVAIEGCTVTLPGGTGAESSGAIPVCCAPGADDKMMIMEAFALLNEHRVENGKPAVTYDPALEASIQAHCEHMRTHPFFAHNAPEPAVASFTTRAGLCGASAGAENIAMGYPSAKSVIEGWKASPGHNANMLGGFRTVGIGKSGSYWGQVFGF